MVKLINDSYFNPNSSLTEKEQEIIKLVYRFHFLKRPQIQKLLNHRYKGRVNIWLNKLSEGGYLRKKYRKTWGEGKKPAIYSQGKNGARYLVENLHVQNKLLQQIIDDEKISEATINHSLAQADFYLLLRDYAFSMNHLIDYYTENDMEEDYKYILKPDAYFKYITKKGTADCFIEIDLETSTRETFRKKVRRYINYYLSNKWKKYFREFPTVGTICVTQKRLENLVLDTEELLRQSNLSDLYFKFTTKGKIEKKGIGKAVWNVALEEKPDTLI